MSWFVGNMVVTTASAKKKPVDVSPPTTVEPALRLVRYGQQLLSRAMLSILLNTFLLASVLVHLSRIAPVYLHQAVTSTLYHLTHSSRWAIHRLWNTAQVKRLRRKIEFEFFTLILGAGGNNLFLLIFWPGWYIIGLAGFALWSWCTK
jgi:hypothetical protein